MIDPTVRRAEPRDAGPLAALEREARATLADVRGGPRWLEEHPPTAGGWAERIATQPVFVAELAADDGGTLDVGYLVLELRGHVAHIDEVYVTPDARELGFGDALVEAAVAAARDAGARVIEGHALPGDRDTKNLFERAGITARLITVSRRLD
jgi:GNAT superfamily N-acetyltransferase